MKRLNRRNFNLKNDLPIKIVQFGEGNFLRAFVDYAFQQLNKTSDFNAGIAIIQPIQTGTVKLLNEQDGLYTLFMNGIKNGKAIQEKELITNVIKGIDPYADYSSFLQLAKEEALEFIISNTTEVGISYLEADQPTMRPPSSFPAKMTLFLQERFQHFQGDPKKGLTIIPCELINYNGEKLREIILKTIKAWKLSDNFKDWIINHNSFHNTLVDRIVPGYPKGEVEKYTKILNYTDHLMVTAESFFLWVIEGNPELRKKIPFEKTNLNVKIVKDIQPFRTRKVRILNGAHTAMVPFSLLFGNSTVQETIEADFTGKFIQKAVFEEIIPTLKMDEAELIAFANEVFDRFRNPYVQHQLSSIALNSISKFKVRVLPSILEYVQLYQKFPTRLIYAFACLIRFYKGTWKDKLLPINDSKSIQDNFEEIWKLPSPDKIIFAVLKNEKFWDQDLNKIEGFQTVLALALTEIETHGIAQGFLNFESSYPTVD